MPSSLRVRGCPDQRQTVLIQMYALMEGEAARGSDGCSILPQVLLDFNGVHIVASVPEGVEGRCDEVAVEGRKHIATFRPAFFFPPRFLMQICSGSDVGWGVPSQPTQPSGEW